nr:glycoside hydrolase family 127 protein [Akkermansiaceae bacterium]
FRFAPFDSLPWLRADLTGEQASPSDNAGWGHVLFRPFKDFSGDISGRFIEIMALDSRGDLGVHPAFRGLLEEVSRQQRPGGYFCASGTINWQQPIDYDGKGDLNNWGRMMPALWGNARLLCGLVETMRAFPADTSIAKAARGLGDFYIAMLPRFNDPARIAEYRAAGSYAAGHVTCWFPAMEGLVKLGNLTGEEKYLDAAKAIAEFYEKFDTIPIDHAHGMLCNQVALLLLFEATKDGSYLTKVEKRWSELVDGGYINPAGGILEKCKVNFSRDEGCAIVDWLRLNLALARVTGNTRYWAMAERTLHNHFLQNQTTKGGFGHRGVRCDDHGVCGFDRDIAEATWCCSYHGELGFIRLRQHLLSRADGMLTLPFALDFTARDGVGTTVSLLRPGLEAGEVMRQRVSLAGQPASVVRVRLPHWAAAVTAVDATGAALAVATTGAWCATAQPVTEVEFIYRGGVYAEDRRCNRLPAGPRPGQPFVLGYGPKILAAEGRTAATPAWPTTLDALKSQGIQPFGAGMRRQDCSFVFGCEP